MKRDSVIEVLVAAARIWKNPDADERKNAVRKTLECENRFTRQALAFAINQQMNLVQPGPMRAWSGEREVQSPVSVGVFGAGNVPLAAFQDYLAVVSSGHEFRGHVSSRSPYLLPAFARTVSELGGPGATFVARDSLIIDSDALIATGTSETAHFVEAGCDAAGILDERRLIRGNRYSVAVVDGRETEDERVALAEDVLLHEGQGCRNVALIFAPQDLDADPFFEAMAVFRGTFPAHPGTSGSLTMQKAFLKAVGIPHAFGEGLEFLVSRGEAEVQPPGHVRWVPIGHPDEAEIWISEHIDELQVVASRDGLDLGAVPESMRCRIGDTQRPPLDWCPDGRDTMEFLRGLS